MTQITLNALSTYLDPGGGGGSNTGKILKTMEIVQRPETLKHSIFTAFKNFKNPRNPRNLRNPQNP